MPLFEVYIPGAGQSGTNFTFRVEAENWMAALKTGFVKLGEQGFQIHNVLVDVQDDNSLHVTEAASGRVFRIRELSEQEAAAAAPKRAAPSWPQAAPAVSSTARTIIERPAIVDESAAPTSPAVPALAPSPAAAAPSAPPTSARPAPTPAPTPAIPPSSAPLPGVRPTMPEMFAPHWEARPLAHVPASIQAAAAPISRPRHVPSSIVELEAPVKAVTGSIGRARSGQRSAKEQLEDALAEVFERVSEVQGRRKLEEGLYFLLDLALEKVPAESGSVFLADAGTGDLRFGAVRGPKAEELLAAKLTVPSGEGIVGFCATEGVSLALSEVQKDPRYYAAVAQRVNYDVRSLLCSPMMSHGRTFGCVQLINRAGGALFSEYEIGLLSYIAHQGALYLNAR